MSPPAPAVEVADRHIAGAVPFILHFVRRRRGAFVLLVAGVLAASTAAIGLQYTLKLFVDGMAGPVSGRAAVWGTLSLFVLLIAVESICWRLVGWLACLTTVGAGVDMRLDLFAYLHRQPMRYFAENLAGSLGQRITSTAGHFGAFVNALVWRILPPCIDFVGAILIFATIELGMSAALGATVIVVTLCLLAFGERGRGLHRRYAGMASQTAGDLVDTIANMWAVKAFSARHREYARLRSLFDKEAGAQRASWMHIEVARLLHDVVLCGAATGMLIWAVMLWTAGRITPGDVVVVTTLTFRILHSSRDLALSLVDLGQHLGFIDDTLKTIGQRQTVLDSPDAETIEVARGDVEFRDVEFSYSGGRSAIAALNLRIPAGQNVGIVGPSGAGKSTFINLLQRLHDPVRGVILIDEKPIRAVTQDSLRAVMAVVPQEIQLFHRTVLDNIRFARPEASDADVERAAQAAHCDGFIRALPCGYDTLVGERGAKLSGGQRQRIGIARAFLKDAPIIIFDEATSALDTESEIEVHRSLTTRFGDRTVIAVAHRLSTLAQFDRVILIEDGRVIQDGSPQQLLEIAGPFRQMWHLQARQHRFADDDPPLDRAVAAE